MFQKILIANRSEIAVRVIRACRELGIRSVAVYSDADRMARHVQLADEAHLLGPAPARESYLDGSKVIDLARTCGADAIHPGYGFLSENADFADAVACAGLVFIGPPGRAMRMMGEKTSARRAMQEAGVPVVPGMVHSLANDSQALEAADAIGYPLLLKAAGGGGGKGMRVVENRDQVAAAFRGATSEARAAFGVGDVYFERYISPARHIEVQVLADAHGNAVYLGERECSIQRRHQKVIEETPSPALTPQIRRRIGEAAVEVARASEYVNAGTVEFILDGNRDFYFLEMNTRLQVEHPVTEEVTGIDLVRAQIEIAAGQPLGFTQDDVHPRGHAIEARVYAEDPFGRFLPSTGTIVSLKEPQGPGVRLDSAIFAGLEVPIYYDPILAKLIVWAADRDQAIARMRRAIDEYEIVGVKTTLPFHRFVLSHPAFVRGEYDTGFVGKEWPVEVAVPEEQELVAAVAAVLVEQRRRRRKSLEPARSTTGDGVERWRTASRGHGLRRM